MKEPTFYGELREQLARLAPNSRAHDMLIRHVCDGHTIAEISKSERLSHQMVSKTLAEHLKFLRHPARIAIVKGFWEGKDPSRLSWYGARSKRVEAPKPVKNPSRIETPPPPAVACNHFQPSKYRFCTG